jgi:transcriptional repressor NrdR
MICPYCAHVKTEVVATIKGLKNERWRKCKKCGKTFPTVEAVTHDAYIESYIKQIEDKKDEK